MIIIMIIITIIIIIIIIIIKKWPCLLTRAAGIHRYIGELWYFFRYEYRYLKCNISWYYDTIKYATSTNLGNLCL